MSKIRFDLVELQILAIYESATREETLDYINEALAYVDEDEVEMITYMKSAAHKLAMISDDEFKRLEVSRYLYEEDDYED